MRKPVKPLDEICGDLIDYVNANMGGEVAGSQFHRRTQKDKVANQNIQRLATQFGLLAHVFAAMGEIAKPGGDCLIEAYKALLKGEIAKPVKLSMPSSRSEMFRRDLLRAMFDTVKVRMPAGELTSLHLGQLWFASDDDGPMPVPSIPHSPLNKER